MKNKIILGCLAAATCEILFGLSFIFTNLLQHRSVTWL